jgi:hypothetical protein
MAYVPPHLRKNANVIKNDKHKNDNKHDKNNKNKVEEFPALGNAPRVSECGLNFKKLFEKRRELRKRRKMKEGWICMSKNGVIDSMTPEQRENERNYFEEQRINTQLDKLIARVERDIEIRMEYEDLTPEELEFSSSSSEESEESELEVQEDEEIDERF